MSIRPLGSLVALGIGGLLLSACLPKEDSSVADSARGQPDFILIVIDALRRDHLGMYGYDKPTSPGMDSLGSNGIIFDNAYSHGSQTFNSTASLLTSKYFPHLLPRPVSKRIEELNSETAARHSRVPILAASNLTLAESLAHGGYQTLGIFTNPHHHSTSGFWQGFDVARYLSPQKGDVAYARGPKIHHAFFEWFDQERVPGPYFAYLHFMDVHNPYRPPRFLRKQFVTVKGRDLYRKGVPKGDRIPTETDLQYMMALYDAEIRFVDLVVEDLVNGLRERDALEDTILFVTSDHGEEFMDHGGLGHGNTLERELIQVPLVIAGLPSEARREPALSRHIDVAPTILELAGIPSAPEFEGHSLLSSESLGEIPGATSSFAAVADLRSLTTPEWHFTFDPKGPRTRLYRHAADPKGLVDLSKEYPAIIQGFLTELDRLEALRALSARQALDAVPAHSENDERQVSDEVLQQLEALGYVDE